MKKFITHILLFLLPVFLCVVCILPFYIVCYAVGEFGDIDKKIEEQRTDNRKLLGLGYNEQTPYYKLKNANDYEAEVIALGTSRAMQYKADYFIGSFYNCGGAVSENYDEYRNFLENLTYTPDMVLLDLDTWVFNDAWNQSCVDYDNYTEIIKTDRNTGTMLRNIIEDWIAGKWKMSDCNKYADNIGFNGRIKDNGFMYDGSYYYGDVYRHPEIQTDYQFKDTKARIESGDRRFEYGSHVDSDTIYQLNNLLEYCAKKDIYVVGYIAPFAPSIYREMNASKNYGYLDEIEPESRAVFEKYGFELYNYMDGKSLNITDEYFIDGFHGSEVAYAVIIKNILAEGSLLERYIDEEKIEYLISDTYDDFVFENPDKRNFESQ